MNIPLARWLKIVILQYVMMSKESCRWQLVHQRQKNLLYFKSDIYFAIWFVWIFFNICLTEPNQLVFVFKAAQCTISYYYGVVLRLFVIQNFDRFVTWCCSLFIKQPSTSNVNARSNSLITCNVTTFWAINLFTLFRWFVHSPLRKIEAYEKSV